MRKQHTFIVSFEYSLRGRLEAVGNEPVKSLEKGIARAEFLNPHYAGVGVYGVWVDDVTCDASDLVELAAFGEVPDLEEVRAA